jgi:hypothetical protein
MTRSPLSRSSSRGMSRGMIFRLLLGNACLGLGIVLLAAFLLLEFNGFTAEPLVPALAALSVGCTAVLDRVAPVRSEE